MKKSVFFLALCLGSAPAYSGIVVDPPVISGSSAIDPAGDQTLDQDAAGAASETALEALSGFAAIQSFTGWSIQGTTNYIVFSDPARPDVRSTYSGLTGSSGGGGTSSTSLRTSGGVSMQIDSGATRTGTLTLDFGSATYASGSVTAFDSSVSAPSAVALTVSGLSNVSTNVSIKYYGTDDTTLLATQTLSPASDPDVADGTAFGSDGYSAYQATGTGVASAIGKVVVTANQVIAGGNGIGIDDLAYTSLGGSYFMTPAGAGSMNGSSWANALPKTQMGTVLNSTMVPGDTLYLGSGNYGTTAIDLWSSGTASKYKRVVGVDTGTGLPLFSGSWVRTNPDSGTDHFIYFGGTGGSTINGCAYWEIRGLQLSKCHYAIKSADITSGPDHNSIILKDIDITLVRHGVYVKDIDNLTFENVSVKGYTKHGFRLDLGCNTVLFKGCEADLSNGDPTWWDHSEPIPFGFIVNNGGAANGNVTFEDCIASNNLRNNQWIDIDNAPTGNFPGTEDVDVDGDRVFDANYWNGDGFVVENNTLGVTLTRCVAINNEDAGFDLKQAVGSTITMADCVAVGNSRNFRFWARPASMTNCVGSFPRKRASPSSNGLENIWFQDAVLAIDRFTSHGTGGTGIKEDGTGSATVTNSILSLTGSTGSFTLNSVTLGTGTVTFRPGSGTDPSYVNPSSAWDGFGDDMNSQTYGNTKGYYSN